MSTEDSGDLAWHDLGAGTGPSLVLLHGFTQTARCWGPFDDALAERWPVRLVDAPGHGDSVCDHADVVEAAELLGRAGGHATYVGYSMGGRVALRLALDRPELVERLVLIGASPGIEDHAEREQRRHRDEALADRIEVVGVAKFLDEWLTQPLFRGLSPEAAHRDERLRNRAASLAASLRCAGIGAQVPLWQRLDELEMPALLVVGADDDKYGEIAERMRDHIGANATVQRVAGAGHTAHLEQPHRSARHVLDWLARTAIR